jgi:hypothetical protein
MSATTAKFSDEEHKQIRDTVNKQRRLVECYQMRHFTGQPVSEEVLQGLILSSQGMVAVIQADAAEHQKATNKSAMTLNGATMVIKQLLSDAVAAREVREAAAAEKSASKKPAKAAKAKK